MKDVCLIELWSDCKPQNIRRYWKKKGYSFLGIQSIYKLYSKRNYKETKNGKNTYMDYNDYWIYFIRSKKSVDNIDLTPEEYSDTFRVIKFKESE